jgi:hypothetical protein
MLVTEKTGKLFLDDASPEQKLEVTGVPPVLYAEARTACWACTWRRPMRATGRST